jgi:hypothetical protein
MMCRVANNVWNAALDPGWKGAKIALDDPDLEIAVNGSRFAFLS